MSWLQLILVAAVAPVVDTLPADPAAGTVAFEAPAAAVGVDELELAFELPNTR